MVPKNTRMRLGLVIFWLLSQANMGHNQLRNRHNIVILKLTPKRQPRI